MNLSKNKYKHEVTKRKELYRTSVIYTRNHRFNIADGIPLNMEYYLHAKALL